MQQNRSVSLTYRVAHLPGLGRVQVPVELTDEEILADIMGDQAETTPVKEKT
ncbi:MAG: hypothetical protein AAF755_01335 [Pseudomonadota bacterium]